jgi:DNA polymerase III subunit beta
VLDDVDILSWLDNEEPAKPTFQVKSAYTNTLTSPEIVGTSFEIGREVLLSLLEKAITVIPTRDMVPVLINFQFRVFEDRLEIVASSLDMSIVVSTTQVETKVPGVEVFPARTLYAIVKESNAGSSIFIEVTNTGAVIVAGGYSVDIKLADGKDFPAMDSISDITFYSVDRLKFINAIASVKYALPGKEYSGQDSLRMINIKGGKFTACDGARFQQVRIDGFKLSMKLPTLGITTLIKTLTSSDIEELEIGETEDRLVFKLGSTIFYVNKLDDPYPNVEQLWLRPALSNTQELLVNRQELLTAIKQVKIAADPTLHAIGLVLEESTLKVVAKDINNSASTIIACKWNGKPKNVVVNYLHLAEMLKAYSPAECKFLLGEDTAAHKVPILLKDDETLALATIAQMLSYRAGLS